ncbi:phosphotransferase family protein [Paralimibaculum aggregatum]|uniref:Phosphotransferase family protein n=1 Tax=Paralimibaculum aggregatum TaxID=3036245 RepID=A0ABQ6LMA0_9RHOB|nr:phosphotransferase family protein [Limibaculum sp. NKW23]GMG81561.1 phosphotransferase family protein [Limibaculum sp. NKW23]
MSDAVTRIRALPIWRGAVQPEPLKGGLSNESYTVEDAGRKSVVRLGHDYPFHHVFRARELMTARAAAAAGFAPAVLHAEPGLMVSAFVEGVTYGEAEVRDNLERLAGFVRRFHEAMPAHVTGAGFLFWPFHVVRDYARTLEAGGSRFGPRLGEFVALAEALEGEQVPLPIRFGHNDLLPANFIDDGSRLWLVDFEYAGFSTAMFDLAGIASNAGFDAGQDQRLLTAYFGAPPGPELIRAHSAMKCASLLREAMWSMVSELHLSAPGVDYEAYTAENLDRLAEALDHHRTRHGKA